MKRHISHSLLLGILITGSLQAATYQLDPAHSSAAFSVRHMMISNVRGAFGKVAGTIDYDPDHLDACKVDATIDVSTVDTREPHRDADLKSPNFFDVAKYPNITFVSKKCEQANGKLQVAGDLTIHGVTKPVVLDVDGPTPEMKDMRGNFHRGATATTNVNRQDFGLVWNKALDSGGVMVGDEVAITLDLDGSRTAAGK